MAKPPLGAWKSARPQWLHLIPELRPVLLQGFPRRQSVRAGRAASCVPCWAVSSAGGSSSAQHRAQAGEQCLGFSLKYRHFHKNRFFRINSEFLDVLQMVTSRALLCFFQKFGRYIRNGHRKSSCCEKSFDLQTVRAWGLGCLVFLKYSESTLHTESGLSWGIIHFHVALSSYYVENCGFLCCPEINVL